MDGRFELPRGLSREEERATLGALERYFLGENPRADPWVLVGRMESTGHGALQTRRYADGAWRFPLRAPFARTGVPSLSGRADAR
jgi:hypothetical protein